MSIDGPGSNQPSEGWAEVGGLQVHYVDWGSDGAPVIALHGLASSCHWYDLVAPLLCQEFRIIAPDQRGHGKTTQARTGYDWETLSKDVAGLMDRLGIQQAAVLGHSWGGHVASAVAAYQPKKVSGLVMIDGGIIDSRISPDGSWEGFAGLLRPRNVSGTRRDFLDRLSNQLSECWSDDLARIVQTMVYEDDDGLIRDILDPYNHAQVIRTMWECPPSSVLPRVACPALIVVAGPKREHEQSEWTQMRRGMVESATHSLQDCRVHWVPETVHDIGYHKPGELAGVIREFLAGL